MAKPSSGQRKLSLCHDLRRGSASTYSNRRIWRDRYNVERTSLCNTLRQVALEFHKWRDQFPGWFQSQFGNKLIYTGAGAADIVLSSRMNLPGKVQARRCSPVTACFRRQN